MDSISNNQNFFEDKNSHYVVLARKYRPDNLKDIIGQDALVRTFINALKCKRVAHAFLLTGIRGTGKTTIARIIAKMLCCTNIEAAELTEPCNNCSNCIAIKSERHSDIIEFDAASHTGVNDVKEIIDSIRYRPVLSKYKVFIIDEVHMLSISAFNALLKTLEEPPLHVKFIFATTEVRKVPLTILSRCQRFDLKRVSTSNLISHFNNILQLEGIKASDDCLKIIANSAQGSVRDGLSILDQAISYCSNESLDTKLIREMLGLAATDDIYLLTESIVNNNITTSLALIQNMYELGVDPINIIQEVMNILHQVIKSTINNKVINSLLEFEKDFIIKICQNAEISKLNLLWNILSKSLEEIRFSHNTLHYLEMILIKLSYISTLPSPHKIIELLSNSQKQEDSNIVKVDRLFNLEEIEDLLTDNGEVILCHHLRNDVRIVEININKIILRTLERAPKNFINSLKIALQKITNHTWKIINSVDDGQPTIASANKRKKEEQFESTKNHPLVTDLLNTFTDLKIADIKLK